MSDLNKFIRDNRAEFDDAEPDPGHFARFESRLARQQAHPHTLARRNAMLRVAALILLLITGSVVVFDFATQEIRNRFTAQDNSGELPAEVREAMQYYDNQAGEKMNTITRLTAGNPEARSLSQASLEEISNLDENTQELTRDLRGNPNNERIIAALIRNQQMKDGIMNTIITQLTPRN
jgi:hypothetical protein